MGTQKRGYDMGEHSKEEGGMDRIPEEVVGGGSCYLLPPEEHEGLMTL